MTIPCGRCIGCRRERARQWAMRCMHEASLYNDNCFITLTYDDEHLKDDSLHVEDFQKFMKRLRKRFPDQLIRYYQAGEYGEKYQRPHYHACLFNFTPPDLQLWRVKDGVRLYTSDIMADTWGHGYCVIGDVTFESAAYVARYIDKKILGGTDEKRTAHYHGRHPEYSTMSRRPGIGSGFLKKWKTDIFPKDYCVVNGKKVKPPKYYDSILEKEEPDVFTEIKSKRIFKIPELVPKHLRLMGRISHVKDCEQERLQVKEKVQKDKYSMFRRELDD